MKCRHGMTIRSDWYECLDCIDENYPDAKGNLDELNRIKRELRSAQLEADWRRVTAEPSPRPATPPAAQPLGSSPSQKVGFKRPMMTLVAGAVLAMVAYPILGLGGCVVRAITNEPDSPGFNNAHYSWFLEAPIGALLIFFLAFTIAMVMLGKSVSR